MGTCLLFSTLVLAAGDSPYPRAEEKAKILERLRAPRPQALMLESLEQAPAGQREFLEFMRDRLWPIWSDFRTMGYEAGMLLVMIDRALYDDEAESERWSERKVELENKITAIANSEEYKALIREWAAIADRHSLQGELATSARNARSDQEIGAFPSEKIPVLQRLNKVMDQVNNLANKVPAAAKRAESERRIKEAVKAFELGSLPLAATTAEIERAELDGDLAFGLQLADQAGDLLNEAAALRTELARSKGFASWAEYSKATEARYYDPELRTVVDQMRFLETLLAETREVYAKYLAVRARELSPNAPLAWRPAQVDHLAQLPMDTLTSDYFPREQGADRSRQAALESGFSLSKLGQITFDSLPREGKMGHGGYMSSVGTHDLKALSIDSRTLHVAVPADNSVDYYEAIIYIVQNLRTDGPEGHETAYHELGHGLHYLHEINPLGESKSYGYVEVPSMSLENFLSDTEHLTRTATNRAGKAMPIALAKALVQNKSVNALLSARTLAARALFELKLWSQQYEQVPSDDPRSFIATSRRLWKEVMMQHVLYEAAPTANYDWSNHSFVRPHFRSGWVQYAGYVFADVASRLVSDTILDRLQKSTGRRSLDQQPTLASHWIPFYRDGWRTTFPKVVEDFTQGPYSLKAYAESITREAARYRAGSASECIALVKPDKMPEQ